MAGLPDRHRVAIHPAPRVPAERRAGHLDGGDAVPAIVEEDGARAINAASGNRPLVVLANLSGFDGSPDSMRNLQLEYGAEIGRAVVNFDGPIVFCVVSRYHGGAFVVFSKALNANMTVLATEGSYASVIGGAPAAAVVFAGEVDARTAADPRVRELEERTAAEEGATRAALATELAELRAVVRSEKLGEVAAEFDGVHSIQRAVAVGSVDAVIAARELRPRLIEAVERGLAQPLRTERLRTPISQRGRRLVPLVTLRGDRGPVTLRGDRGPVTLRGDRGPATLRGGRPVRRPAAVRRTRRTIHRWSRRR